MENNQKAKQMTSLFLFKQIIEDVAIVNSLTRAGFIHGALKCFIKSIERF
jgi:hypothetical protein